MEEHTMINTTISNENDRLNDQYPEFLESIKNTFASLIGNGVPLFRTDSGKLFDAFLSNLPIEARQYYNCDACKHFVKRFGGLVTINPSGEIIPVMWSYVMVPNFFAASVKAMKEIVLKSKIIDVFLSEDKVLGYPVTGNYHHMSVELPDSMVYHSKLKTAKQEMSEKVEEFKMLSQSLKQYSQQLACKAIAILMSESLYRSEKFLGPAKWLRDLHYKLNDVLNLNTRNNIMWLAVATAPTGYCHIKNTVIGTLLDDINDGMSFDAIKRRFNNKTKSAQYQHKQTPPSVGNIMQAEKIIEKMGLEKSLERRFAKFDEIEKIWVSKAKMLNEQKPSGIFSHLIPEAKDDNKEKLQMDIPAITMTWVKFLDKVLPTAETIEYLVEPCKAHYSGIVTAAHYDAPPIIQWDNEEKRNPFSWYLYDGGSHYSQWGLTPGYCKVTGICYQPSMWHGEYPQLGKGAFFILEGARDTRYENTNGGGNCLFPEILISELREIRSTIEAYAAKATIAGYDESSACGILVQNVYNWNITLRVTAGDIVSTYKLDRWD